MTVTKATLNRLMAEAKAKTGKPMAEQISDADKLWRIRVMMEAYDAGECDADCLINNVRISLDQRAVSKADIEASKVEVRRLMALGLLK